MDYNIAKEDRNLVKEFLKRIKWESLITAIMAILIGVAFVVWPQNTGNVLCYISGVIFIILGVSAIIRSIAMGLAISAEYMVFGLALLLGGIFCLVRPDAVKGIITVIFGVYLVADGISKMRYGVICSRSQVRGSWVLFIISVLTVALGCVVMFGSFDSVMLIAGISLIVDGVFDIITTLVFSSHIRKFEKTMKDYLQETIEY